MARATTPAPNPEPAASSLRGMSLVVDDDPDIVLALENRITWMGHEPLTAADGKEALRIIHNDQPDLVLLDIQLPGLSGLEILEQIRDTIGTQAFSDREAASLPPESSWFLAPWSGPLSWVRQ